MAKYCCARQKWYVYMRACVARRTGFVTGRKGFSSSHWNCLTSWCWSVLLPLSTLLSPPQSLSSITTTTTTIKYRQHFRFYLCVFLLNRMSFQSYRFVTILSAWPHFNRDLSNGSYNTRRYTDCHTSFLLFFFKHPSFFSSPSLLLLLTLLLLPLVLLFVAFASLLHHCRPCQTAVSAKGKKKILDRFNIEMFSRISLPFSLSWSYTFSFFFLLACVFCPFSSFLSFFFPLLFSACHFNLLFKHVAWSAKVKLGPSYPPPLQTSLHYVCVHICWQTQRWLYI